MKILPNFFIPEAQTPEFLNIEAQYRQVIANQGFISDLNQTFIRIPEIQFKHLDNPKNG